MTLYLHRLLAVLAFLVACGDQDRQPTVPRWTVGPSTLALGIEEGPPSELEFANVTSAVLFPDASLAIANSGTSEIRYFAATGRFLRSTGRRGQGPGEFSGAPLYLHARGQDTLLVYDAGNFRLTSLDGLGRLRSSMDLARTDSLGVTWFPRLYPGAFLEADEAPAVRPCIDQLVPGIAKRPEFPSAILVRVDQLGYLWATLLPLPPDTPISWRIYNLSGGLVATATLPPNLTPFQIRAEDLLGRLQDSLGVEHVVVMPLARGRGSPLTCAPSASPAISSDSAALHAIRNASRAAIQAQEAYYAAHATYASRSEALTAPGLSGIHLVVLESDKRHWFGLLIDPRTGTTCATGVGYQPPGWQEAVSRCSASVRDQL